MTVLDEYYRLNSEWDFFKTHLFDIKLTPDRLKVILAQTWKKMQLQYPSLLQPSKTPHPTLLCFDTEEMTIIEKIPFCTMGILSQHPSGFSVFGNLPDHIAFSSGLNGCVLLCSDHQVLPQIPFDKNWEAIIWGANKAEREMLLKNGFQVYHEVQQSVKRFLGSEAPIKIVDAEQRLIPWFHRQSCGFWKHKQEWDAYYDKKEFTKYIGFQMFYSLARTVNNLPLQKCAICGKPQDILLYCLEDAISSFFLFLKSLE
jgi:hypothetical protein